MIPDFKITLYGEYGVGKTSLTRRLLHKNFNAQSPSTIGAAFMTWKPDLVKSEERRTMSFGIWDTAGQERFNSLLPMYLRKSDAIFYCWDYNNPFDSKIVDPMYDRAIEYSPDCHFYLVITKIDEIESMD